MDDGLSEKDPTGWGEVGLLDAAVDGLGGGDGVDVRPQEEEVNDDVDDLEKKTFSPLGRSHILLVGEREEGDDGSRWLNRSEAWWIQSGSVVFLFPTRLI